MLVVESELHLATVSRQLDLAQSNGRTSVSAWEPLRKVRMLHRTSALHFKTNARVFPSQANIKRTMISAGLLGFQQLVGATFVSHASPVQQDHLLTMFSGCQVTSYLTYFL